MKRYLDFFRVSMTQMYFSPYLYSPLSIMVFFILHVDDVVQKASTLRDPCK